MFVGITTHGEDLSVKIGKRKSRFIVSSTQFWPNPRTTGLLRVSCQLSEYKNVSVPSDVTSIGLVRRTLLSNATYVPSSREPQERREP